MFLQMHGSSKKSERTVEASARKMLLNPILQVILKGVCSSKNMLTMNKKQKIF